MEEGLIKDLLKKIPQVGRVEWISIRPQRREPPQSIPEVQVTQEAGLVGDHFASQHSKKRQVTLIQSEHLTAVAGLLHRETIDPGLTRRNIVVSGINLLALKGLRFQIGSAILAGTGLCHPCTRMEENFGAGGYNAMRGHGGITAEVIEDGIIKVGDKVRLLNEET
ncbi:MAG: MOSC domain-containing protein [Bacteroidota bacterium]